jgi:hypothetical protein
LKGEPGSPVGDKRGGDAAPLSLTNPGFLSNALALCILAAVCVGCGASWTERREPTTDAERKAVAEHVQKILAVTPSTLGGHDQDWDDAIAEAHRQARATLCRPTLWEWDGNNYTGRWKYSTEIK